MIIRVGGCYGSEAPGYRSVGFLINDELLLEGGTVTSAFTLQEQEAVKDILISHIHLDHTKELFFFLDNRAQMKSRTVTLSGIGEIIDGARQYLFNHQIWPDFSQLSNAGDPFLAFRVLEEGVFSSVGEFEVKPVRVNHPVTATGFIIREKGRAVAYTGDTGPTRAFWEEASKEEGLAAVIAETSFPNAMEEVALASGHLTPALLAGELDILGRPGVPILVFHMKPIHVDSIKAELNAIGRDNIELLHDGRSYEF
jgi:cAMP phosphodiesterase